MLAFVLFAVFIVEERDINTGVMVALVVAELLFVTVLLESPVIPDIVDIGIALVDVMLLLPTDTVVCVLMVVGTTELEGDDTVGVSAAGSELDN